MEKNRIDILMLEKIEESTESFIEDLSFDTLYTDAQSLSLDFDMDRSNVSRTLNRFHRENLLVKIQGRPTLFLLRDVLSKRFPNTHFSSVITDKEKFVKSVHRAESIEKETLKDATEFSGIIGNNQNESLFEPMERLRVFSDYPNNRYNMLIVGDSFTGKSEIVKLVHRNGVINQKYSEKTLSFECNPFFTSTESLLQFLNLLEDTQDRNLTILVTVKGICTLEKQTQITFLKALNEIQLNTNKHRKQYIFLETDINDEQIDIYRMIISNYIDIPTFDDRTLKEKVEYVLDRFQRESETIQRSIYINKNILSCFVTAKYPSNLLSLENEIKYAVSNSIFRNRDSKDTLIDLEFDDLSDYLLNSISNVSNQLETFNALMDYISERGLYFVPGIPLQALISLQNSFVEVDNTVVSRSHSLIPLSRYVKREVDGSYSDEINTIRSINISEIYDCIYPLLSDDVATEDQLLLRLFSHLDSVIRELKNNTYKQAYFNDFEYVRPGIIAVVQKITSSLQNKFDVTLPKIEISYIQAYLMNVRTYTVKGSIPVLLVSHSYDIANSYREYLKSLNFKTTIDVFLYNESSSKKTAVIVQNQLNDHIDTIDQGRGVVVVTDVDSISSILQEHFKKSKGSGICINPMTLQALIGICTLTEKPNTVISDFDRFNHQILSLQNEALMTNDPLLSSKFLHDVSNKILSESLVFLDVRKSTALLSTVLLNIYEHSGIIYTDELSIRFLHHCSFMIERNIRNEPLQIKNTNQIIKEMADLYQIIEQEFQIINNHFGIQIPPSELAMIVEIFVNS